MLAIVGTALYLLHDHTKKVAPENHLEEPQHYRARGTLGARSFTKTAPERETTKMPKPMRKEQPPELKKIHVHEKYVEPPHLTAARLDRLYEAQSDGPLGWARGKVDKDNQLIHKRMPYHHPGLTKINV